MPEISRFFGIVVMMFHEDHAPPHFHARYAGQHAVFTIHPVRLLSGTFSPRARGLVVEWAERHRAELEDDWERARRGEALRRIEPLE